MHVELPGGSGSVSALLELPSNAWLLYVMAHGAGVGMRHRFLESMTAALAQRGVATFRYQFPYMEAGRRRPDPPDLLQATVRAAVKHAGAIAPGVPLIAGGKSLGGRMTSHAASQTPLIGVLGLAFLGFPLHPPGKPGINRAAHLDRVEVPMLFLQGTCDQFAELDLLQPVCQDLGERATLHLIEGGDHSFNVPKRSGHTPAEVIDELSDTLVSWARLLIEKEARA